MDKLRSRLPFDTDDVLGYNTVKMVRIRDRRVGLLSAFCYAGSLAFIIFYLIVDQKGYLEYDTVDMSMRLSLYQPDILDVTGTSSYCGTCTQYNGEIGCNCLLWDDYDLVYPEEEEYSSFIATYVNSSYSQARIPSCGGGVCGIPWTAGTATTPHYLVAVDRYDIHLFHHVTALHFYQQDVASSHASGKQTTSEWDKDSLDLWGQIVDQEGMAVFNSEEGKLDVFPLGVLLQAAGTTLEEIQQEGGIIRVIISYGTCDELINSKDKESINHCEEYLKTGVGPINYYQYQPMLIKGTSFSLTRVMYDINQNTRSLIEMRGIRLIFLESGNPSKFSLPNLLVSVVSGYILFTFISFLIDFIVVFIIPGSKVYRAAKFEQTENFSDLRNNLMKENNIKKQIEAVTKMARFKGVSEVEKMIATLKTSVQASEFEKIVLACIEVYGTELMDHKSAQIFFPMLNTDTARVTAYILLKSLKEAYLLAAKMESSEEVKRIQRVAAEEDNQRVLALCEQYLNSNNPSKVEV